MQSQRKILLVDDESSLRRTLSLSLSQYGYDTEPCENGMNALKKLESYDHNQAQFSAIVLDIMLPDIEGTKLAKIIKFRYPGIPIILITGYADKVNPQEIQDLKIHALLEKPFSAEELTDQVDHIIKTKTEPVAETAPQENKSASSYLLLKLGEDADYINTYQKLFYMENVLYCDATKGDYDILLLIQAKDMETCRKISAEKIQTMEGVEHVEFLSVDKPVLDETTDKIIASAENALSDDTANFGKSREMGNRVCSYILLEVDREKMDTVYPTLRLSDNVVFCDYCSGKYNLVLFVHGSYFTEIDNFIEEKLINMNGILKIKEFPVINLMEM